VSWHKITDRNPKRVLKGTLMTNDKVGAGAGLEWFKGGWQIFRENPLVWALIAVVFFAIALALNFIPLVGGVAFVVILPVLMAGVFRLASGDEPMEVGGLFAVFRDAPRRTALMVLGLLMFAVSLAISLTLGLALFGPLADLTDPSVTPDLELLFDQLFSLRNLVLLLALLIVQLVAGFGFVFAVGLVTFRDGRPAEAFVAGVKAAFNHLLPLVVFGTIYAVLAFVAAIPLGLGFLVLLPVTMIGGYCAYRDLFGSSIVA
jgi:hypothetical protein